VKRKISYEEEVKGEYQNKKINSTPVGKNSSFVTPKQKEIPKETPPKQE